jgi:adenosylcobinamide-phosphate synthase
MTLLQYIVLIILSSVLLDWFIGEPPYRSHPVVWIGKIISFFTKKIKGTDSININKEKGHEKILGIALALSLTLATGIIAYLVILQSLHILGAIGFILLSVFILKTTFSIKSMDMHIKDIITEIENKDIEKARNNLSRIVSRRTESLNEEKILSACIECIAESYVDGILSPLFYYGLANIPGAIMFRVVNTLDSMIAYKDEYHKDIGWMSAKMDTILNFIPARLSIIFLLTATYLLKQDFKNSIIICKRDRKNTESVNAGIPMSIVAGALNVQLEKMGQYRIGDMNDGLSIEKCKTSLKLTKIASIIFITVFLFPLVAILNNMGWWTMLFD